MFSKIKIVHIDKTKSTQDAVIEYLQNDYYPSLLLIAKIQTKGRGRKDDDWYSPEGGFWATLGISISTFLNESQLALFHYFTAILLAQIIKEEYKLSVQIKWPNDILYKEKKLGGILIDYVISSQNNYLLIGTGVNLNNSNTELPRDLKSIVISIKDILNRSVSLDDFGHQFCLQANRYFTPIIDNNNELIQELIHEYNHLSRIYNKEVILDDKKKYLCIGINHKGEMQFRKEEIALNLTIDDSPRIREIISP